MGTKGEDAASPEIQKGIGRLLTDNDDAVLRHPLRQGNSNVQQAFAVAFVDEGGSPPPGESDGASVASLKIAHIRARMKGAHSQC